MLDRLTNKTKDIYFSVSADSLVNNMMSELREYSLHTYNHSQRVAILALELGAVNNKSGSELAVLAYSGLLHDVGKLYIPKKILNKKDILDSSESELIKDHVRNSINLCKPFDHPILGIVAAHHEYQQNPYPRSSHFDYHEFSHSGRNFNEKIDSLAQIVAVSDEYDALAMPRPYKPRFEIDEIEMILRNNFIGNETYIDQILQLTSENESLLLH